MGDTVSSLRRQLIDQLRHLLEETETALPLLQNLPDALLTRRIENWSVKELYASLASFDDGVILPLLQQITTTGEGSVAWEDHRLPECSANTESMEHILSRVREARVRVLTFIEDMPANTWTRTCRIDHTRCDVYALLYRLTQHNTDRLRMIARHLHR